MSYRSARSRRRVLKRGIREFPALLRSVRPGIRFTAVISASLATEPAELYEPDALSDRLRTTLRGAAADAVRRMDPLDLPTAQDACTRNLRETRRIDGCSGLEVRATARLTLGPEDEEAVRALLAASRSQGIQEALARQRNGALAEELAHPAGAFAWWLQQPNANLAEQPTKEKLREAAEMLRTYPSEREEPIEAQLLTVLRDFLGTFSRTEQKRMLLNLLADGMRAARQPVHARNVEALAAQNGNASAAPESP
jgi:hypothetical protein